MDLGELFPTHERDHEILRIAPYDRKLPLLLDLV